MLIAQLKKETNIAEYLIYMFQIEDIIRSYNFDLGKIEENIISKYPQSDEVKLKIREWYQTLIHLMKEEGIEKKGHLSYIIEDIKGVGILHQTLLTTIQDKKYKQKYEVAKVHIAELMQKSDGKYINEIDTCLNGLYGLMVLRLKGQHISEATKTSMATISAMLAHLVVQYNDMKIGKLSLTDEMKN